MISAIKNVKKHGGCTSLAQPPSRLRRFSGENVLCVAGVSLSPRLHHNRPSRVLRSSAWCTADRGCSQPPRLL